MLWYDSNFTHFNIVVFQYNNRFIKNCTLLSILLSESAANISSYSIAGQGVLQVCEEGGFGGCMLCSGRMLGAKSGGKNLQKNPSFFFH